MKKDCKKIIVLAVKAFCIFIVLLVFYSILIEPNLLRVYSKNLYLPNYSAEHNGLKIAVMSDFHFLKYGINEKKLKEIVEKTNAQNPDLIFLLGDIDAKSILKYKLNIDGLTGSFSNLHSKYGVYSVLGNHDYNKDKTVAKMLKRAGINLLQDDLSALKINGKNLYIYGLKDFWYSRYNDKLIDRNQKDGSIIVLSHNPDNFPYIPSNVSLVLSGHTHGGGIYLPFIGGLFCSSVYKQRFMKGYVVENNKHLFVTSGLGSWIPVRFGNIPEIVILNLYSQKSFPEKTIINTLPKHEFIAVDMVNLYNLYLKKFKKRTINIY